MKTVNGAIVRTPDDRIITENEFSPAAEEFSYGNDVHHKRTNQAGVVMGTNGSLVSVCYYDKETGKIQDAVNISMSDLINDSSK
ncbi:hypothetical protein LCGC14_2677850 [marine sediment metagenome]|uniref:Uncharacterized protein n=1 Tax=marine sediment metagenome TaxID=412755 RepID=A0A0F9A9U5_9ZZZZ